MNRILLAGAAAIALTLGAGAANAQAKFEVKLGGDAIFEAGFIGQDRDTNIRSTDFWNRFRLNFIATGKADNGLEYGGRFRLRNNVNERTTESDRAYIFVSGGFGTVQAGTHTSWSDDHGSVFRPIDYHLGSLGFWDDATTFASQNNAATGISSALANVTLTPQSRGTKIIYFSPRFAGFEIGASYTPQPSSNFTDINRIKNASNRYTDVWEAGVNYKNNFNGVTVEGSAVYAAGRNDLSTFEGYRGYQLGAKVGYAGFTIGGGYQNEGKGGLAKSAAYKSDTSIWNVGVQYETGPITVGAGYEYGKREGDVTVAADDKQDYYSVGAAYKVAPGLNVGAEYSYIKFKDERRAVSGGDDKANVVILRSWLQF